MTLLCCDQLLLADISVSVVDVVVEVMMVEWWMAVRAWVVS